MEKPRFRCSELARVVACPGSKVLRSLIPDKGSDIATLGNGIHYQIAKRFIEEHGAVGDLEESHSAIPIPDSKSWVVDNLVNRALPRLPSDFALAVEDEFEVDFGSFILTGHIDLYGVREDGQVVKGWDWKTGYIFQDAADNNLQVAGYVALLGMSYPDADYIEFEVSQPLALVDSSEQRFSTVELKSRAAVDATIAYIKKEIETVIENKNKLSTGVKQCEYCIGLACPAQQKLKNKMELLLEEGMLEKVGELTSEALSDLARNAKVLGASLDAVLTETKSRLTNGQVMRCSDGAVWTTKERGGTYEILKPMELFDGIAGIIGEEKTKAIAKVSISDARESVGEALDLPKTSKKGDSADAVLKERFGHCFKQKINIIMELKS